MEMEKYRERGANWATHDSPVSPQLGILIDSLIVASGISNYLAQVKASLLDYKILSTQHLSKFEVNSMVVSNIIYID